jgi:hypothetical protein
MDSDPPPLRPRELLARFITASRWIRPDDTIRQDAFIPPRDLQLSVTRHDDLSENELWAIGDDVAKKVLQNELATAHGRADVQLQHVLQQKLWAELAPIPGNPNHVHIVGWPEEKSARKNRAQQLAAAAGKVVYPPLK